MTDIYAQLAGRGARVGAQLGALVVVVAAVALAFSDQTATRAVTALLLGGLALISLKLGLVSLQRQRSPQSAASSRELTDLRSEVDEIRLLLGVSTEEVDRLASTVDPIAEGLVHHQALARRTEPAIAEFATLRHEVLYLREAVDRLRADLDS